MSVQVAETSVRRTITVNAPIERAFSVFTDGIDTWWDPNHHLVEGFDHMVLEPRVGGNIYDVGKDGSECRWARVLAYEPPHRLVFSWDITTDWQIETDFERASEVEVTFTAQGPNTTLVELRHLHLDRHGP